MPAAWQNVALKKGKELKQKVEMERCNNDTVYFIDHYCQIFETRPQYGIGFKPFVLRPKQVEFVRLLDKALAEEWPEIVAKKCRDQGGTLVFLAWLYHKWLFKPHFSAIIGSRKEDMVRLMPGHDTLFAKLWDYIANTPEWMMPVGWNEETDFRKMKLFNPANGNTITGDSCTEDFGVGGRSTVIFRDESARWPIDTSQNTRFTCQLQVDISTVYGKNHFEDQCDAAEKYGRLFTFFWWDNPNFTREWYIEQRKLAEAKGQLHIFKREVDIDFNASIEGQIYPGIFDVPVGHYKYNPDWPLWTFWDFGFTDMGYCGFLQRNPATGDLYLIDEVYNSHVGVEWFVPFIPGRYLPSSDYVYSDEQRKKQAEHRRWSRKGIKFWGDPTGNQRTAARGESVFDILKKYNIKVRCGPGWQNMAKRQEKAAAMLTRLHIDESCKYFINSFTQYVVPERDPNSQSTTAPTRGVHKWSHAVSAFEAAALTEPEPGFEEERELSADDIWGIGNEWDTN